MQTSGKNRYTFCEGIKIEFDEESVCRPKERGTLELWYYLQGGFKFQDLNSIFNFLISFFPSSPMPFLTSTTFYFPLFYTLTCPFLLSSIPLFPYILSLSLLSRLYPPLVGTDQKGQVPIGVISEAGGTAHAGPLQGHLHPGNDRVQGRRCGDQEQLRCGARADQLPALEDRHISVPLGRHRCMEPAHPIVQVH